VLKRVLKWTLIELPIIIFIFFIFTNVHHGSWWLLDIHAKFCWVIFTNTVK